MVIVNLQLCFSFASKLHDFLLSSRATSMRWFADSDELLAMFLPAKRAPAHYPKWSSGAIVFMTHLLLSFWKVIAPMVASRCKH
ncbi:unnamed protein product [Peronospora belbahrii]|uniref:Uncharacterized protein n=1 Tax=Peronospora belbahrii TaxID=622444 RepID=A0AAU9KYP1_9STRA|nr:unnamed protein product [Peronospora belbahrii]